MISHKLQSQRPNRNSVSREPSCCHQTKKEKNQFFVASSKQTVSGRRRRTPEAKSSPEGSSVQESDRQRAKSPELLGECFISFYFHQQWKNRTLYKRLQFSQFFKQAKMVSDLFPNKCSGQIKRETSPAAQHSARLSHTFHLALAPRTIPHRAFCLTFILKEFSAVVVWIRASSSGG